MGTTQTVSSIFCNKSETLDKFFYLSREFDLYPDEIFSVVDLYLVTYTKTSKKNFPLHLLPDKMTEFSSCG